MTKRTLACVGGCAAVALMAMAVAPAAAQTSKKPGAAMKTVDGQPDIQGHWGDILENIASVRTIWPAKSF